MLIRRLFDDIEQLWGPGEPAVSEAAVARMFMPAIDVSRRGDQLVVCVDLPGMAADDVQVMITDDALIVEGERRVESEVRGEGVWRSERSYGRFQRVIPLPEGAEPDSVEARFENGVLEIALRAPENKQRGRKVEIKQAPGEQAKGSRETH
jgi:HSP20 family protein